MFYQLSEYLFMEWESNEVSCEKWKQVLWLSAPELFTGVVLLEFPGLQFVRETVDSSSSRPGPEGQGMPLLVGFAALSTISSKDYSSY